MARVEHWLFFLHMACASIPSFTLAISFASLQGIYRRFYNAFGTSSYIYPSLSLSGLYCISKAFDPTTFLDRSALVQGLRVGQCSCWIDYFQAWK